MGEKIPFFGREILPTQRQKSFCVFVSNLKNRIFHCIIGLRTHKKYVKLSFFLFLSFFVSYRKLSECSILPMEVVWALLSILMHVLRNVACIQLNLAAWIFPCVFGKAERKIKTRRENFFFGSAIHQFLLWPSCISSIVKRTRTERPTHHQVALTQRKCCENLCILLPSRFVFHLLGNLE